MNSITVSGKPGTGTSTLCKLLHESTQLEYVYAGQIFREEAARRGMDLATFGALCEDDPSVDQALDENQAALLRAGPLILEGRLSGWLAGREGVDALRIYISCDDHERFRRLAQRDGGSANDQANLSRAREASEESRYQQYYGINPNDTTHYDLVLDSSQQTPEQLQAEVLAAWRAFSQ